MCPCTSCRKEVPTGVICLACYEEQRNFLLKEIQDRDDEIRRLRTMLSFAKEAMESSQP